MFTPGEVDDLLSAAYRLRELGDRADNVSHDCDVTIDIARSTDGSVIVFPALAA